MIFKVNFDFYNRYVFSFNRVLKNLILLVIVLFAFNLFFFIINKIGGLGLILSNFVNFVNYIFLVLIFSFGVNAIIFFIKAHEEEKKMKNSIDDFEKFFKNFLLFLFVTLVLLALRGFEGSLGYIDIKKFAISSLIVSSIIFYFYDKTSINFLKEQISLSNDNKGINSIGSNFKAESFEEDMQKFANVKNLSLNLSLENQKDFHLKDFPSLADMFIKLLSVKNDKESLQIIKSFINMLNNTFLNKGFDLTSFNYKINMLELMFFNFLYNGKKFLPMLVIAYFVYLYQEIGNLEAKKLLRLKLKSLINSKNVNNPKRMVEILLSWQYIHKVNNKPIPSIKRIPKFFKKLLKVTFENYSPLTLKKSKMLNCSIKLKDLVKILHPKPSNNLLAVLYGGIIQNSKISKLKENEYLPNVIENDRIMLEKIRDLPINALLRNLRNINFENAYLCLALEERFKDIVANLDKLKRFVNIFDFYMPFFIVSEKEISEIFEYIKNQKISNVIKENFSVSKFSTYLGKEVAIDIVKESFDFASFGVDKIEKISVAIDYLLLAEKFIRLSITYPDKKLYSFMSQKDYLSIRNKDKIKFILNEVLHLYFERNKMNQSIDIIINLNRTVNFSSLAKAVSFLTSKYKYYRMIVISDKVEVCTEEYNRVVSGFMPIDKYLRTIGYFAELSRFLPDVSDISVFYGYLYDYVLNFDKNFIVLDAFYGQYYQEKVFSYISKIYQYLKKDIKGVIYDYLGICPGYYKIKNFTVLSAKIDRFVFDIIDSTLFL